jgi:hypothetical protein
MSPRQAPAGVTMPALPTGHDGREKAHVALHVQAEHCANPPPHRGGGGLGVVDRSVGESLSATRTAGIEMANVVELRVSSRA